MLATTKAAGSGPARSDSAPMTRMDTATPEGSSVALSVTTDGSSSSDAEVSSRLL